MGGHKQLLGEARPPRSDGTEANSHWRRDRVRLPVFNDLTRKRDDQFILYIFSRQRRICDDALKEKLALATK